MYGHVHIIANFSAISNSNWTSYRPIQEVIAQVIGLCTMRSHGTRSHMLVRKLRSGTSKTKAGPGGLVRVTLFWKSHCATCTPACVILYHVNGLRKGPISKSDERVARGLI